MRAEEPLRERHPIGIFDSGVGGLSVWREIVRQVPQAGTYYVADSAHVPYGSRSLSDVRAFSEGITRFLLGRGARVILLACNTASAPALHYLRRIFRGYPLWGWNPPSNLRPNARAPASWASSRPRPPSRATS